jgi:hypothetical protein
MSSSTILMRVVPKVKRNYKFHSIPKQKHPFQPAFESFEFNPFIRREYKPDIEEHWYRKA